MTKKNTFLLSLLFAFSIVYIPWTNLLYDQLYISDHFSILTKYSKMNIESDILFAERSILGYLEGETLAKYIFVKLLSFINSILEPKYFFIANFSNQNEYLISSNVEITFQVVSIFTLFIWSFFLFKKIPFLLGTLFLLNPITLDMTLGVIQNSFSFSLIIIAILLSKSRLQYIFLIAAPFVHNSALLVLGIIAIQKTIIPKLKDKVSLVFSIMLIAILSIASLYLLNFEIEENTLTLGKKLFIFNDDKLLFLLTFAFIGIIQVLCSEEYIRKHYLIIQILFIYLLLSLFTPFAFRFIACLFPLLFYSLWDLPGDKKVFVYPIWIIFVTYLLIMWINLF